MYKLNINSYIKELIPFSITQVLGLFVALRLLKLSANEVFDIPGGFKFNIIDIIILGVVIFLFIFFSKRGGKAGTIFFKVFLSLAIFSGLQLALGSFLNSYLSLTLSFVLIGLFLYRNNVIIQNVVMIIAIAGIGALFGLTISPVFAVILLSVLSIYDIIAVYKTKHMVTMANAMVKSGAIFGFVIPNKTSLSTEKIKNVSPGENFMILGSGDIVMPLILTASVAKTSLVGGITVLLFSLVGLFLTHLIFTNQKKRRPMAALPPIALLSIIGYLLFLIV